MKSRMIFALRAALPVLALGLAAPVWSQDAGPMPAGQNAPPPVAAPAPASAPEPAPAPSPANATVAAAPASPAAKPEMIEVPGGTHIPLVIHNAISTRSARPGDPVYFETLFPVMIDGNVVIPAGSYMSGEVTDAKRAGRVKGRAELGNQIDHDDSAELVHGESQCNAEQRRVRAAAKRSITKGKW